MSLSEEAAKRIRRGKSRPTMPEWWPLFGGVLAVVVTVGFIVGLLRSPSEPAGEASPDLPGSLLDPDEVPLPVPPGEAPNLGDPPDPAAPSGEDPGPGGATTGSTVAPADEMVELALLAGGTIEVPAGAVAAGQIAVGADGVRGDPVVVASVPGQLVLSFTVDTAVEEVVTQVSVTVVESPGGWVVNN